MHHGACIIKLFMVVATDFAIVSPLILVYKDTLAFYARELITAVKCFIIQAQGKQSQHFNFFITYKWDQ
jgi:hypothetical protein